MDAECCVATFPFKAGIWSGDTIRIGFVLLQVSVGATTRRSHRGTSTWSGPARSAAPPTAPGSGAQRAPDHSALQAAHVGHREPCHRPFLEHLPWPRLRGGPAREGQQPVHSAVQGDRAGSNGRAGGADDHPGGLIEPSSKSIYA